MCVQKRTTPNNTFTQVEGSEIVIPPPTLLSVIE